MQKYEYRAIPAPARAAKVKGIKDPAERHAHTLSALMNEMAAEGWDYLRADVLPCAERKGLTGSVTVYNTMLVFRRPTADALAATMTRAQPVATAQPTPPPIAPSVIVPPVSAAPVPAAPVAPQAPPVASAPTPHAEAPPVETPPASQIDEAADAVEEPERPAPPYSDEPTAPAPVLPLSARVNEGAAPPLVLRRDNDVPATAPAPQSNAAPSQAARRPGWPFTH